MDAAGLSRAATAGGYWMARGGADSNVQMEEDVEARGTPTPIPLKPGGRVVHVEPLRSYQQSEHNAEIPLEYRLPLLSHARPGLT